MEKMAVTSTPEKTSPQNYLRKLYSIYFFSLFVCLFVCILPFLFHGFSRPSETLKEKAPSGRVWSALFPKRKLRRNKGPLKV